MGNSVDSKKSRPWSKSLACSHHCSNHPLDPTSLPRIHQGLSPFWWSGCWNCHCSFTMENWIVLPVAAAPLSMSQLPLGCLAEISSIVMMVYHCNGFLWLSPLVFYLALSDIAMTQSTARACVAVTVQKV